MKSRQWDCEVEFESVKSSSPEFLDALVENFVVSYIFGCFFPKIMSEEPCLFNTGLNQFIFYSCDNTLTKESIGVGGEAEQ